MLTVLSCRRKQFIHGDKHHNTSYTGKYDAEHQIIHNGQQNQPTQQRAQWFR